MRKISEGGFDLTTRHIVDRLIEERAPWMVSNRWFVRLVRPLVLFMLQYKVVRRLHAEHEDWPSDKVIQRGAELFAPRIACAGLKNIPAKGAAMIVVNHPTGITDGIVVDSLVRRRRPDRYIFANHDIIRLWPHFATLIAPVEWRESQRTLAKTRTTLAFVRRAVAAGKIGIIFPSGRIAKRRGFKLYEREWMVSAVMLARKYELPIIPMHLTARNSLLYYVFDMLHETLRDLTLFREMMNKGRQVYKVRVGAPIAPDSLSGDNHADTRVLFEAVRGLAHDTTPLQVVTNYA